jgi:RNA polymerase sigma factor (sigma-70 family)
VRTDPAVTTDFRDVYDECVWDVYGFFAYRVGSRPEAEDLTQLTFERALRAWNRFDARRATPRTWLLSIAHNLLVDHYRRDRARAFEPIGDDGTPEDALPHHSDREADLDLAPELAAALETLGRREREIIALRFGGDLTGPQIADLLGLTLSNVQQILSRSLRKLRSSLEGPERERRAAVPR